MTTTTTDGVTTGPTWRGAVRAELTKATSTPLLAWVVGLSLLLPPLLAAALGGAMGSREAYCARPGNECRNVLEPPDVTVATIGVLGDGVPGAALTVLAGFAAALLLVELRHLTLGTALLLTPQRWRLALAKVALVVVVTVPVVLVGTVASAVAFEQTGGPAAVRVDALSVATLDVAVRTTAVVVALALATFGIAALSRNVWVTTAVVVLWPSLLEPAVPMLLPGGDAVAAYLPFAHARHFVGIEGGPVTWSPLVSGAYVALLAVVLLVAGVARLSRVDLPRSP